jgi:tRNA C32,U32 (ribose-2'-O)-methylase TrmJ
MNHFGLSYIMVKNWKENVSFILIEPKEPGNIGASAPLSFSLNLAQSVLLVAYELSQKTYKTDVPALVKHEEPEASDR